MFHCILSFPAEVNHPQLYGSTSNIDDPAPFIQGELWEAGPWRTMCSKSEIPMEDH